MHRLKTVLCLILMLFVFLTAPLAYALITEEGITNRWGVGLNVSGALPSDHAARGDIYMGTNITYGLKDYLALQLEIGYVEFSERAFGIDYGDLEGVPLLFNVQLRKQLYVLNNPAAIYGILGVGVVFWDFQNAQTPIDRNVRADASEALAFKLGAGFEVFLNQSVAWNIEGGYVFTKEEVDLVEPGTGQIKTVDSDFWMLGSGVKLYF